MALTGPSPDGRSLQRCMLRCALHGSQPHFFFKRLSLHQRRRTEGLSQGPVRLKGRAGSEGG
eukprot:359802-Chlamydomonas_euryale.AAC.5